MVAHLAYSPDFVHVPFQTIMAEQELRDVSEALFFFVALLASQPVTFSVRYWGVGAFFHFFLRSPRVPGVGRSVSWEAGGRGGYVSLTEARPSTKVSRRKMPYPLFPCLRGFSLILGPALQVMMLHMIIGQVPGWLQVWREIEMSVKPRLAVLQTRRSVRQRSQPVAAGVGNGGQRVRVHSFSQSFFFITTLVTEKMCIAGHK